MPEGVVAAFRPIGVCKTPRATKAKIVETVDGYWVPYDGATIIVNFTYDNSATAPTLNVDYSGAYGIYYGDSPIQTSTSWIANSTVEFVFDAASSCYRYLGFPKASSSSSGDGDTKNTAGSTDTSNKIFLIGATSQAANPQTYSHDTAYVGTDGCLYSGGAKVLTSATDEKVKMTSYSTSANLPLLCATAASPTSGSSYGTYYNTGVYANLNTKYIYSSGFFQTSDERYKNFNGSILVDLDKLSGLRKEYFTWKEGENKDVQIGMSAQEIQKIYPEIVSEDSETGKLTVAYDKLSVVALAAVDKLHVENQELKDRLTKLEEIIYGNRNK